MVICKITLNSTNGASPHSIPPESPCDDGIYRSAESTPIPTQAKSETGSFSMAGVSAVSSDDDTVSQEVDAVTRVDEDGEISDDQAEEVLMNKKNLTDIRGADELDAHKSLRR
uniref:Uncharacterized protein n=1 Tax=Heterorhabditis bacteriophora TaxID=37862 RepID=A0A1I7WH58_HETBA